VRPHHIRAELALDETNPPKQQTPNTKGVNVKKNRRENASCANTPICGPSFLSLSLSLSLSLPSSLALSPSLCLCPPLLFARLPLVLLLTWTSSRPLECDRLWCVTKSLSQRSRQHRALRPSRPALPISYSRNNKKGFGGVGIDEGGVRNRAGGERSRLEGCMPTDEGGARAIVSGRGRKTRGAGYLKDKRAVQQPFAS